MAGMLMLVYCMWSLDKSLFQYKLEKIETLQGIDSIPTMEGYGNPVYVYPNERIGPTYAPSYDLTVRCEYRNVKGNLSIDDYYVNYGSIPYESRQKLDGRLVTGNGSITFVIPPTYVGVHLIVATPDYKPTPPIEIKIYTIHYESQPDKRPIISSLAFGFIGSFLASIGMALTIVGNKQN